MAADPLDAALNIGAIPLENTAIFMCDLQEKFRPAMLHFAQVIMNAKKLVDSTKVLAIPLIVTEQYPQGLGSTVSEIDIQHAAGIFPKTKFSMLIPEVENIIKTVCNGSVRCAVLFGVEAHVCVEQTATDLISRGIKVHIVADATTSRTQEDRLLALERLKQIGCFITTSETVIYKLLGDKNHPKFNEIRPLIKDTTLETGLVSKMDNFSLETLTWQNKLGLVHAVLTELSTSGRITCSISDLMKQLIYLKDKAIAPIRRETRMENFDTATSQGDLNQNEQSSKQTVCNICGKSFGRPQELKRHLRTHDETSNFLCEICGKSYRSPDGLSYHKALSHPHKDPASSSDVSNALSCSLCGKCFLNEIQFKTHLKNSHQRAKSVYTCTVCVPEKTFKRKDVFKTHVTMHERPKPFKCLLCAKSFSSRSNLQSHSRTHDSASVLQCSTCAKKFNSKTKLSLHTAECLNRKFCSSCKFFCQREEDLIEHMKRSHPADYAMQAVFGQNLQELT